MYKSKSDLSVHEERKIDRVGVWLHPCTWLDDERVSDVAMSKRQIMRESGAPERWCARACRRAYRRAVVGHVRGEHARPRV